MKERKPRSLKLGHRGMGKDMCPYCLAFNCDSAYISPKARAKFDKRIKAGLCPSCGKPVVKDKCGCKTNIRNKS